MQPEHLFEAIAPHIDHLMVDGLNYRRQVRGIFHKQGWDDALTDGYAQETGALLLQRWESLGSSDSVNKT